MDPEAAKVIFTTIFISAFVILFGLAVYFFPSLVSNERQRGSVFVINLFLGWTLIGWVVALALAVWPEDKAKTEAPQGD